MSAAFSQSFSRSIGYRLPARQLIKFALLYVLKRGFLDGRPGFTYALRSDRMPVRVGWVEL